MTILTETLLDSIRNNTLDYLHLQCLTLTEINDTNAQTLANALSSNCTLTALDLSSSTNQIGNTGAQALAAALESNYTLIRLDFNSENIKNIEDNTMERITGRLTCNRQHVDQPGPGYPDIANSSAAALNDGGMLSAAAPTPHEPEADFKEEVAGLPQAIEPEDEALPIRERPIADIAQQVTTEIITPYKERLNMENQSLCAQTYRFFFKHTGLSRLNKLENLCQHPDDNAEYRKTLIQHLWQILQSNSKIMKPLVIVFLLEQCKVAAIEGAHSQTEIQAIKSALTQADLLPNAAP